MVWYVSSFLLYSYSEVNLCSYQLKVRVEKEEFNTIVMSQILSEFLTMQIERCP